MFDTRNLVDNGGDDLAVAANIVLSALNDKIKQKHSISST